MRRVAVTGMGIVSCIGNNTQEVLSNLREGKSGISKSEEHVNLGFRSQIYGKPDLDPEDYLDKKVRRFMGMGAAWNYISMQQAIEDSGLEENDVINEKTGIIMGSGGPSTKTLVESDRYNQRKGSKKSRSFCCSKSNVINKLSNFSYTFWYKRYQLFYFLRLRNLFPLYKQCL
jgi:3-oxoacyl-(acyl-carrier-protein) synthase